MRVVPLAATANQAFTITLNNVRWALTLKEARGVMCVDVTRDGVTLVSGSRIIAGEAVIPYRYLQTANFVFVTVADELPAWQQFGITQTFVYLTADEIASINAMTVGDFAPFEPSYLLDPNGFYLTTDTGEILTDD